MIRKYLTSLDWPRYTMMYAIGMMPEHVLDTKDESPSCDTYIKYVRTRCLFSTYLAQYMINREDPWPAIPLPRTLNGIKAMNIEIDVDEHIDHMFMLVNLDGWYIIQSYIGLYTCIIEKVDIHQLMKAIRRWETDGVSIDEWYQWFHARIPSRMEGIRTRSHVYATNRIRWSNVMDGTDLIDARIDRLMANRGSYIHSDDFTCLLSVI